MHKRKVIADTFCEIYDLIKDQVDDSFWNWNEHELVPGAIYIIGRHEFTRNVLEIRELAAKGTILPVLCNPMEGADPMAWQVHHLGLDPLVDEKKVLIVSGGDLPEKYQYLFYENFLPKIHDYEENLQAIKDAEAIYTKTDKPYKFLFLNGRQRTHRKYMLERFKMSGLLNESLWTNLDGNGIFPLSLKLMQGDQNLVSGAFEVQHLPSKYEVDRYREQVGKPLENRGRDKFSKYQLFSGEWGEIYLTPDPYIDTYFSLVTETVFDYPLSFRTEKIWKPIAMGHPWITVSNAGYYRDFRNIGFKTFGHLIDESFDTIDNPQDRIERVSTVVEDLCCQDLPAFLAAAQDVCKYNQQHMIELRSQVRKELPDRFSQFIKKYE